MGILQWIVIGVLVYAIYYIINKYERKVDELTRLIELNRDEIDKISRKIVKKSPKPVKVWQRVKKNLNLIRTLSKN
jgi:hypothetical protein